MWVYVHMCLCTQIWEHRETRMGARSHGVWVTHVCKMSNLLNGCWDPSSCPHDCAASTLHPWAFFIAASYICQKWLLYFDITVESGKLYNITGISQALSLISPNINSLQNYNKISQPKKILTRKESRCKAFMLLQECFVVPSDAAASWLLFCFSKSSKLFLLVSLKFYLNNLLNFKCRMFFSFRIAPFFQRNSVEPCRSAQLLCVSLSLLTSSAVCFTNITYSVVSGLLQVSSHFSWSC